MVFENLQNQFLTPLVNLSIARGEALKPLHENSFFHVPSPRRRGLGRGF